MKTLLKAMHNETTAPQDTFPNILEDNYKSISKSSHGLIALIQPLIIAVGHRLAQIDGNSLEKEKNNQLYKVSQGILSDFVKITSVSMAMLDRDLNYISMSQSWKNDPFLISNSNDPIGKSYTDVSPWQDPNWIGILQKALLGKFIHVQEDQCTLPDGQQRWMRWEIHPWEDEKDKIGGIVLFSEDITDKKVMQQQTNRLMREKTDLESFAYMCPHDLQSHMKTLSNFISFLAQSDHRRNDADVSEYYKFIFEALENMKNLIDDCLLHAQIKTESLIKFPQDLNEIVHSIMGILKAQIQSKKAKITCDVLPTVWCHKQTIKQVFENLITNALKFSVNKPHIHIYAEENDNNWVIHVKDDGIGISDEDQQQLFQSFYRIHSKDKYPGTGLGLSFCKKIVELHEGEIWVKSTEGKGSTFSISFPKRTDHNDNYAALGNTTASIQ
jgi:signal transduction histidine kinase